MPKRLQQALLAEATGVASVSAVDQAQHLLFQSLRIEVLPAHETRLLPLEVINVSEEAMLVRSAKRLVKSISRIGVLQPPSVVGLPQSDDQPRYEVIAGRRRVLAARLAGLSILKCEVYERCTPQLAAFLALVENAQRSAAWVKEVEDLHRLLDERVGMTLDELTACGFERNGLTERLKIARLPAPILDQILAGKVSLEVARKLTRLNENQLARLCQVAEAEELTAEAVKQALKAQIEVGLAPLQAALPTFPPIPFWERPLGPISVSEPHPPEERASITAQPAVTSDDVSLSQVLTILHTFTHSSAYQRLPDLQPITQALVQQLEIALREQTSASGASPQSMSEPALIN
jgi:ParB/RepB/Spo0J family partition protein